MLERRSDTIDQPAKDGAAPVKRQGCIVWSTVCRLRKDTAVTKTQTRPWDAADYVKTEGDIVAYIDAALDDGDPMLIATALGDVARVRGMTKVAVDAGLGRESLYRALSPGGNPKFATVIKVMRALGVRFRTVGR